MSVCKGIRHCVRAQLAFRPPAVVARSRHAPSFVGLSVSLQSPPIQTLSTLLYVSGSSVRSYWWSSKSTAATTLSKTEAPLSGPISTPPEISNGVKLDDSASNLSASEQAVTDGEAVIASVSDLPSDAIPPPSLQLGDLKELGFCNFTPVGAVQAALEYIQVTTGLPWWGTITLATVLARLAILHFALKSTRVTARMAPFRPQLDSLMNEVKEAKLSGDHLRMQVAVLKVNKLRKDNGFGVGASIVGPFSQGVMTISMFFGIKKLCDYPLAQMKFESVGWLNSLTAPDPYYILPALSLALMNLQIHLGRADMVAGGKHMLHFANGFRVLGVVFLPFVAHLPAGLMIHLILNISIVAIQTAVLRNPAVRRALKIPQVPTLSPTEFPSLRDTWNAFFQWLENQKMQATQKARERANVPTFPSTQPTSTTTRRKRSF